jgi:hypothetical protein
MNVDIDAQTASLAEHKVGTELDRLAKTELARMRRAILAKQRREQSRYIGAALADAAGTRYTPGELAAACGGAIAAALASTRSMRLTADDWGDLRSDLMMAALKHGAECDARRTTPDTPPRDERNGTGRPAEVLAYIDRWLAQPVRLARTVGHPDSATLPRREDLAGKEQRDPGAYLHGAARHLVAKIAERGATDTDKRASTAEVDAAAVKDATSDPLSMAELGAALKVSKREAWALEAAAGTAPAELAAEHAKTLGAMRTALDKGRTSLRARTDADTLRSLAATLRHRPDPATAPDWTLPMLNGARPMYPTERNAPTGAARAADVIRYMDEVLALTIDVPAAALERADLHTRGTADARRNTKTPRTTGGYLVTDHPTALLIGADGRHRLVPAIGPVNVRTMPADLPTLNRRAINGHRLWTAMHPHNRPHPPVAYSPPRAYRPEHIDLTGADYRPVPTVRPPVGHPETDYVPTKTHGGGGSLAGKPCQAHSGAFTPNIVKDLTARRIHAIQANRRVRDDARKAAQTAGKLTVLPAGA